MLALTKVVAVDGREVVRFPIYSVLKRELTELVAGLDVRV